MNIRMMLSLCICLLLYSHGVRFLSKFPCNRCLRLYYSPLIPIPVEKHVQVLYGEIFFRLLFHINTSLIISLFTSDYI